MKNLRLYFLALPLLMLSQGAWADIFSSGSGTSTNPYLISSATDLQELSTMSNSSSWSTYQKAYYKVTADIDMSSVDNFEPICHTATTASGFLGTFDGDGHVISNLKMTIAADNSGHIGLIGCLQKNSSGTGYIKNVILNGVTITNNYEGAEAFSIGGLSGRDGSCLIENCAVLGFSISKENAKKATNHGNGPFGYLSHSTTSILRFCCTDYASLAGKGEDAVIENSVKQGETLNIATNENLVYFGKYVNASYASLKGKVTANINMSGKAWTGMTGFAGTFDGGGFTISNLAAPLFINTASGAAIKNLTLEGTLTGGQYFAPFVTYCNGKLSIDKCINKVSVTSTGVQVGGFIGYVAANASATITNSENQAAITSSADQVAGFVGRLRTGANLTMTNCKNSGNLKGLRSVGGMWGQANSGGTVLLTLCSNTGNVTTTQTEGDDSRGGGIVGFVYSADKVTIEKCWNSGNITGSWKRSGGIVGSVNDGIVEINNCYNIGNVTENSAGRAILGYTASSNVSITNCWANATIQSKTFTTATYTNCYYTHLDADGTGVPKVTADQLASGEVAYKLGDAWYQTIGTDNYPIFDETHGIVNYISAAGYTTQCIPSTDVEIPSGVEAYAGVIKGSSVSLVAIENAISKEDAVVLKGDEGYYSFVPTTGATQAATNDLQGSDGTKNGGEGIYALAKKNDVVGFYPVAASVTIPAGKAYIEYNGAGVKGFNFVFDGDDATGIGLTPDPSPVGEGSIYNLAGQRMDNSQLKRGIYIVNGKKILK